MNKSVLLSIVIPVYNVECYLKECIESILKQTYDVEEVEVLLIDDGSTDKSGIICDNYESKYPELVKVFHKKNQGLFLTRNFGHKVAIGKYIVNCDSDDFFENKAIKQLFDIIKNSNADCIIYNLNTFDGKNKNPFFLAYLRKFAMVRFQKKY